MKQVGIFGEPGNVELTIRADILWNLVVDGSGYFATCFGTGITTLGNGSGTLSHSFGPWSIGTPCDFSHAIAITDGEPIPLISRTYLHALGGAVVDLNLGKMNFWDSARQPINGYSSSLQPIRGLAPVPEPPTSLQLLLTLFPAAVLCVACHLSGTSNVEEAGLIQSTVKPGGA